MSRGLSMKPKSSYPSLKPQYLQSPWLGISLCLRSSNPEDDFQNCRPMASIKADFDRVFAYSISLSLKVALFIFIAILSMLI
ncbi:hypothetical protein SLE2022_276250 [Rubroshorea leprosula]